MQYTYAKQYGQDSRWDKSVDKGIIQNAKEDKLSFPKLLAKLRRETEVRIRKEIRGSYYAIGLCSNIPANARVQVRDNFVYERNNWTLPFTGPTCKLADYWYHRLGVNHAI